MFRTHIENQEYLFPVFKFLSHAHADALMRRGNGRISSLSGFQNTAKHEGMVHDPEEGQVTIRNRYTHFHGLGKDANGLLPIYSNPYEIVRVFNHTIEQLIEFRNAFAYCVTQHFFSDSVLQWAKERNKDSCVLIKDFPKFLALVHAATPENAQFLGVRECAYIGRLIDEENPGRDSISNYLLTHPQDVCFVKPANYVDQREVRAVWLVGSDAHPDHFEFDVPEIAPLCLSIDYSSIRYAINEGRDPKKLAYGARIFLKNSREPDFYRIQSPPEICSPVLFRKGSDPWRFGFWYGPRKANIQGLDARPSCVGVVFSPIGLIFSTVVLDDIERIEFTCDDA